MGRREGDEVGDLTSLVYFPGGHKGQGWDQAEDKWPGASSGSTCVAGHKHLGHLLLIPGHYEGFGLEVGWLVHQLVFTWGVVLQMVA